MRTISQNPNENNTGVSLWTLEDVEKAQAKQRSMDVDETQPSTIDDDDLYGDGGITDQMLVELDIDI